MNRSAEVLQDADFAAALCLLAIRCCRDEIYFDRDSDAAHQVRHEESCARQDADHDKARSSIDQGDLGAKLPNADANLLFRQDHTSRTFCIGSVSQAYAHSMVAGGFELTS